MLRVIIIFIVPFAVALIGGTASAWYAIDTFSGFNTFKAGSWTSQPSAGTETSDPYVRAQVARNGMIPLGPAEGLSFTASRDNEGQRLDLSCDYRIEGDIPPSRLWTIFAATENGEALSHPVLTVNALHSRQVVRGSDGQTVISMSATPKPGNWIGLSGTGAFDIVLTLYDAPSANRSRSDITPVSMPQIHRINCA